MDQLEEWLKLALILVMRFDFANGEQFPRMNEEFGIENIAKGIEASTEQSKGHQATSSTSRRHGKKPRTSDELVQMIDLVEYGLPTLSGYWVQKGIVNDQTESIIEYIDPSMTFVQARGALDADEVQIDHLGYVAGEFDGKGYDRSKESEEEIMDLDMDKFAKKCHNSEGLKEKKDKNKRVKSHGDDGKSEGSARTKRRDENERKSHLEQLHAESQTITRRWKWYNNFKRRDKMTTYNSLVLLFVLALALNESRVVIGRKHVYVGNDLGEGLILNLHCKSKDDDLGTHALSYRQNYTWGFKSTFFGSTLFWCNFQWGNVRDSHEVFNAAEKEMQDKTNNLWLARQDGLYYYNHDEDEYQLKYEWGKTKSKGN
ncbi:hypothetical protein HHK36_020383 [Tetracentron sinense]|uniref:S-protein homolog n=1 Tax=Tetracentron sinense TaxID=13715 RepID=A0A834YYW7_TETSI|nr:hypothetical protein HHK36_020383 [Tetracentron sinense]